MKGLFMKRQFCCQLIMATLFAILSSPLSAHTAHPNEQPSHSLLVEADWLYERLGAPRLVIIDTRTPEEYMQGHIAGAINIPSSETYHATLSHRVVSLSSIQQVLGSHGIHRDDHVIIYDCGVYLDAARFLWVLLLYGHAHVAILNGGYPAWRNAGLPSDTHVPVRVPARYRAAIRPGLMATRLQMLLAIDNPSVAIVDTRDTEEYRGAESRASRSGHIPGAINIPAALNLEMRQGVQYIKSRSELEKLYKSVADYNRVILYCNNGCESSTSYLALRLLGKQVSIYDGGWVEWGNNPGLPVVISGQ